MVEDPIKQNEEILTLTRENNKILHGMRRHQRWASIFAVMYWLAILGAGAVAFHFVQPYLETILDAYEQIKTTLGKIPSF